MNYLIMCQAARHEISSEEKIVRGDKFKCFETCPKRGTCSLVSKGEFLVRSIATVSSVKNPISVVKKDGIFYKVGEENKVISNPTVEVKIQNSFSTIKESEEKEESGTFFGFNKSTSASTNEKNEQIGFGFARVNQNSQAQNQGGSSYRDRFSQFNKPNTEVKKKISSLVKETEFSSVFLGGRMYSNDFGLQRTRGAQPLGKILDELKAHWQISFVFKDQHNLTKEFIWVLLKLKIIPNENKEDEIQKLLDSTIFDNPISDKNSKFFYLIMLLFPQARANGFYFSENYSFARLLPIFIDNEDYVNKFFQSGAVGENFRELTQKHIAEVMYYLNYTDKYPTKENRNHFLNEMYEKQNSLFDDFIIRHYESTNHFVHVSKIGDKFHVEDLGDAETFVNELNFPLAIELQRKKVAFLKKFRFTREGNLLIRKADSPLVETSKPEFETSNVYEALNLTSPSYYLEEYNLYTTLVKEYLTAMEPNEITLNGVIYISKSGFINEIYNILLEACEAALCKELPKRESYINKALLLFSLLQRGVLDVFVSRNQSENEYQKFLILFEKLVKNQITVEEYSNTFKNDALFYLNGESLNAREYLLKSIKEWSIKEVRTRISNNQILSYYYKDDIDKEKAIDAKIKKFDQMYQRFLK